MDISLADERVLKLQEQLTMDQAEGRAWSHKVEAFGNVERMTSMLRRPKDDDFELVYKEHRYQPFWHIECGARYVYERRREYPITISGAEVTAVTIDEHDYPVSNGRVLLRAVEHCQESPHQEVLMDGYTGERLPTLASYLQFPANEIPLSELDELGSKGVIIVPPQARATAVVRNVLLDVLKSLQADQIIEDYVEISRVDLYYRPVYAFQYRWLSKQKEAVMEMDGVTGVQQNEGKTFQQYMGKIVDADFLFDIGIDTIDLLVPGGGIAIKLARKGIKVARTRGSL